MGIIGIGVDVVHLPRVLALTRRRTADKLASRILSPLELTHWKDVSSSQPESAQIRFLAVRWALKEAAYKAVYPTLIPTWKEFTYHRLHPLSKRKPYLQYKSRTGEQSPIKLHSSVSHDGDYVFTTVLAEI